MTRILINVTQVFGDIEYLYNAITIPDGGNRWAPINIYMPFVNTLLMCINTSAVYRDISPGMDDETVIDEVIQQIVDDYADVLTGVSDREYNELYYALDQIVKRINDVDIYGGRTIGAEMVDGNYTGLIWLKTTG